MPWFGDFVGETVQLLSHTFLFTIIFSNDSLVRGRSILSGILASVFRKPVLMVSKFGPDLVQMLQSRLSGPFLATTHY